MPFSARTHSCLSRLHSVCFSQVPQVKLVHSSMRSGKTRTSILPFYASSSTSHITYLSASRRFKMMSPARTRNLSKDPSRLTAPCFSKSLLTDALFLLHRFVSISKNYRSVIRACMEELQQVAGQYFINTLVIEFHFSDDQISFSCSFFKRCRSCHSVWKSGLYHLYLCTNRHISLELMLIRVFKL